MPKINKIIIAVLIAGFSTYALSGTSFFRYLGGINIAQGTADPSTAQKGDFYFNTSSNNFKGYNGSAWGPIGGSGGGGGINYAALDTSFTASKQTNSDAEATVGDWAAFANAASPQWGSLTGGSPASTITRTTTAGHFIDGIASFEIAKSAANRQGEGASLLVNIPPGYRGQNAQITMPFQVQTGTLAQGDLEVASYDVTNSASISISCNQGAASTPSSVTTAGLIVCNLVIPSSTAQMRIGFYFASTSTTAITVDFDDVIFGPPTNIGSVSQAKYYGSLSYANTASCVWSVSQSTFASDFSSVAACASPVATGNIIAPGSKIPSFSFNSAPGTYYFVARGGIKKDSTASGEYCDFRFYDGTNSGGDQVVWPSSAAESFAVPTINGTISYTSSGLQTVKIQVRSSASTQCSIDAATATGLIIDVFYYPSQSQTVANASQVANSWSGYHNNSCSFGRTNTAYGDPGTGGGGCALVERLNRNFGTVATYAGPLPGVVFTPSRAGSYYVCTHGVWAGSAGAFAARLWDGTTVIAETDQSDLVANNFGPLTLCGNYLATSTSPVTLSIQTKAGSGTVTIANSGEPGASSIEWSISQNDVSTPAPYFVGAVTSASASVVRLDSAYIANNGSTCSITRQTGTWLASVSKTATGQCTAVISSGEFSTAPICSCTPIDTGSRWCNLNADTTTTSFVTNTWFSSGAANEDIHIICMGLH